MRFCKGFAPVFIQDFPLRLTEGLSQGSSNVHKRLVLGEPPTIHKNPQNKKDKKTKNKKTKTKKTKKQSLWFRILANPLHFVYLVGLLVNVSAGSFFGLLLVPTHAQSN